MLRAMSRKLPPQYAGWEAHERAFRRMSTAELVQEVQDGPPDRRLAALSVIDISDVSHETIEDWIRTLPDAEANELAGAIPAQRPHSNCSEDLHWVEVAALGYTNRRLPTFLVMLFSSLEAAEARGCPEAPSAWERTAGWLAEVYDTLADDDDLDAMEDISLFVFENYLDRDAVFEVFGDLVGRHRELALNLSANPHKYLGDLDEARQKVALEEAERGGGLPFWDSWSALNG
jgi:hypothetical protein